MSVYRRGLYDRIEIQRMTHTYSEYMAEVLCYKKKKYNENLLVKENLISTANVIILDLIYHYNNRFLTKLEFVHAIEKVIAYAKATDMLFTENIFYKFGQEIIKPYLHTEPYIGLYV